MIRLPPMPESIAKLPRDSRGYPVPFFVAWIDGKPDHRLADPLKLRRCVRESLCWVCGEKLVGPGTFAIGPMCAINRISAEPPSHFECVNFSARACPFLSKPKAVRRDANLPDGIVDPAGVMIERNPGVTLAWTAESFKLIGDPNGGTLFKIGEPLALKWYSEGREATREEVLESIQSGYPILHKMACAEGKRTEFKSAYRKALELVPA